MADCGLARCLPADARDEGPSEEGALRAALALKH
jgi:hypothetical protein